MITRLVDEEANTIVVKRVVLLTIGGGSSCFSYDRVYKEVLKGVRVVPSSNNKRGRKSGYKGVLLSRVLLSTIIREIYVEDVGPYKLYLKS